VLELFPSTVYEGRFLKPTFGCFHFKLIIKAIYYLQAGNILSQSFHQKNKNKKKNKKNMTLQKLLGGMKVKKQHLKKGKHKNVGLHYLMTKALTST